MKIFISYSHEDNCFREQLEKRLSALKRQGSISSSSWTDKEIISGQEWESEIDKNLEEASLILLLVSPDFLSSEYCCDVEMKKALAKHDLGETVVVPIIIRPCDWKSAPFGKLQLLPKKAKAVSSWDNEDEAWLNVVTELKRTISYAKEKITKTTSQGIASTRVVNQEFDRWLEDTEIELTHRHINKVTLQDLFVWPDLKSLNNDIEHVSHSIKALEILEEKACTLIFGDEQSGKTTLSKSFFKELVKRDKIPILIQGEKINSTADIRELVQKSFSRQYTGELDSVADKEKVLIIDNYSSNKLNKKFQNKFIENIKTEFEEVILFAIDSYQYVASEIDALGDFCRYEILNFGNVKRTELIKKWVSMGVEEQIAETSLYTEIDGIKLKIEALTRGGILPSKPIFILTLLQMFESVNPQKVELTSYGHCYQYLIYQALEKASVKNAELDQYINLLTELGFTQFSNQGKGFNNDELDEFFKKYSCKYLNLGKAKMSEVLLKSGILVKRNDRVVFRYLYIYYFFAAKKLAESISNDQSVKNNIQSLLTNLHREDCANIIIFITHHSKDNWVLEEIQSCLMKLFNEYTEADLEKESLEFMADFVDGIPGLVIEHRKVERERRKHDEQLERIEQNSESDNKKNENLEPTDTLAKINRVFKGIEIIGQIIRNRHGSLNKEQIEDLASQACSVGLRFLKFFLTISSASKEGVVKLIECMLRENTSITNEKLEKQAKKIFLLMNYGAIYGVLRKVSMSIGCKEVEEIYKKIENKSPSPAIKLINQVIYLQFNKKLNAKSIKTLAHEFKGNPTCERLLKEIVIQHIYMFPVDFRQKQQIANILKIPVLRQEILSHKKDFRA